MPYSDILYSIDNGVATIAINRPARLNAMTGDTVKELEAAVRAAGSDPQVGVVVMTGVGERAFCAGGDVHWEADGGLKDMDSEIDKLLIQCPKPTIARVNGYAIAGGNHLAYFCDLTVAAEHAIFGQNGPRVGSPAAGHMVSHSANILGHKRAREMWMLCRRYTAAQMLDWGLVNAVVPMAKLDAEVRKWADELMAVSPTCLKVLKQSFANAMDWSEMPDVVNQVAPGYFETGEQAEGAAAFLEKRKPDFSPWR